MWILVLAAIAAGALAALPPSTWRDAQRLMQGRLDALEAAVGPVAERATHWLADGAGTLREAFGAGSSGPTLSGFARVVDGDTLKIRGTQVRLYGIDAPERAQRCRAGGRRWPCGREAARALSRRIGGRTVVCEERDRDRYGRSVGVCRAGGEDLNASMAAAGWAFAYRRYSLRYLPEEWAGEGGRPRHLARRRGSTVGLAQGQAPRMTGNFLPDFHPVATHGSEAAVPCLVRENAVHTTPEERRRQRGPPRLVHDKWEAKD